MGQRDGGFAHSPDVSPFSLTEGMFREKHRKKGESSLILSL
jgi:hypothetical protein